MSIQSFYHSMDWFKGKSTGSHRFSHEIWGFPVIFPLNQSIESYNDFVLMSQDFPYSSRIFIVISDDPSIFSLAISGTDKNWSYRFHICLAYVSGLCLREHPHKIWPNIWVCLKIGYIPNYSHLIGIMIINHWV